MTKGTVDVNVNININNLSELIELIRDIAVKLSPTGPMPPVIPEPDVAQTETPVNMKAAQGAPNRKTLPQATQPVAPATQAAAPQQPTLPTISKRYTFDEIAAAATKLVRDKGDPARAALRELNSALGIASLKELTPDCFGEYAMKLRNMGVNI